MVQDYFSHIEFTELFPKLIASAVLLVLWPLLKHLVRKLIVKYGTLKHKVLSRIRQARRVVGILLDVLFVVMFIIVWGVEPKSLLIGLSSVVAFAGVALFAQWSVLSNVTAGIIMYFNAPFHLGDRIRIIDKDIPVEAVIEEIKAFYTYIRTDNDEIITIPNNVFMQKIVSVKKTPEQLYE